MTPIAELMRDATIRTVARSMRRVAHQLAAQIEHSMEGLTPEQRGDLRLLPCDLLQWADAIDPDGAPAVEEAQPVVVQFPGEWRKIPVHMVGD